jgi:hypothetical protein
VPRKRIQPNKRWLISKPPRPVARPLSTAERARLKEIPGLPEAALPAVEEIAARFIRRAKYPTPSKAETRAALRFLRNQVTRLRKAISETDLYTLHVISPNYVRRLRGDHGWKQDDPGLLERVDSHLNELLMKIDFEREDGSTDAGDRYRAALHQSRRGGAVHPGRPRRISESSPPIEHQRHRARSGCMKKCLPETARASAIAVTTERPGS